MYVHLQAHIRIYMYMYIISLIIIIVHGGVLDPPSYNMTYAYNVASVPGLPRYAFRRFYCER